MKNILVPTDFSKNAGRALEYAVMLARKFKANITLLHAWLPDPDALVAWTVIEAESVFKEENVEKMEKMCAFYAKRYKMKFSYVLRESVLSEFIKETVKKKKIDLIVMGTKGASKIKNRLFGSNAARAIEKSPCPLIVIPEKAAISSPSKIVFATDYYTDDLQKIKKLVEFGTPFKSHIEILHVAEETDAYTEKLFLESFAKKIKKSSPYPKLAFKIVVGSKVTTTLENYAAKHHIDLMVMTSAQRTLFERLFVSSITKKASYHTKYPLLIFHQD